MKFLNWLFGRTQVEPLPVIDLATVDGNVYFVTVDVETANEDIGSICQIGICVAENDGSMDSLSILINPNQPFSAVNTALHGIDAAMVRHSLTFAQALPQIAPLLARHPVIAHSDFDRRALAAACGHCNLPVPPARWLDSVTLARRAWPDLPNHKLKTLADHLGISFDHHDAEADARATAQIVVAAERQTGQTFEQILAPRPRTFAPAVRATGDATGPLFGQIAVFTGALAMSRAAAAGHAAAAGITVTTSVSKKTTLLIVGDQDLMVLGGHTKSTKHRKAEELIAQGVPIRIVGESEFLALIGTAG